MHAFFAENRVLHFAEGESMQKQERAKHRYESKPGIDAVNSPQTNIIDYLYLHKEKPDAPTMEALFVYMRDILDPAKKDQHVISALNELLENYASKHFVQDVHFNKNYAAILLQKLGVHFTPDQRNQLATQAVKIATQEKDVFRQVQILDLVHCFDPKVYDATECATMVKNAGEAAVERFKSFWLAAKPTTAQERIAAYNTYVKDMYWLISRQHSPDGQRNAREMLAHLQKEMAGLVEKQKDEFIAYLEARKAKERSVEDTDKDISTTLEETFRQYGDTHKKMVVDEEWYFHGQREDLWLGMQAAFKLREGTRGKSDGGLTCGADGYPLYTRKSMDGKETRWRFEPSFENTVLMRCIEGPHAGAVSSISYTRLYDTLADNKMSELIKATIDKRTDADTVWKTLQSRLQQEKKRSIYTAKDGTKWRVWGMNSIVAIGPDTDEKPPAFLVTTHDLIGAGIDEIFTRAAAYYKSEAEGRKKLEAYELPVETLRQKKRRVASIILVPQVDGHEYNDISSGALGDAMYRSAVLRQRYGDVIDMRPPIFADDPKAGLRAGIEAAYADGCRVFDINIPTHGSDQFFIFPTPLRPSHFLSIVDEFRKKDPDCRFNLWSFSCFGGGTRYELFRALQQDPSLAAHVNAFLDVKPITVSQPTSYEVPEAIEQQRKNLRGISGLKDTGSAGGIYQAEFMKSLLKDGKIRYGKASSDADLASPSQTPEAILEGILITAIDGASSRHMRAAS